MQTSTVTGRFTSALIDSIDSDTIALTGSVVLTPSTAVLTEENDTPVTVLPTRTVIDLGPNGELPATQVMATNSWGASPQDWTYTVTFNLQTNEGRPVYYDAFDFRAPAGEVMDLTTVTPVIKSNGVVITRGVDGTDISDMSVAGTTLTVLLSDGTSHAIDLPVLNPDNVVVVDGEDGADGIGITSVVDNGDSTITVNYSDGTSSAPITIPTVAGQQGLPGADGNDGQSAYELAVAEGFSGSLSDWLTSLKGEAGLDGSDGSSGSDGRSAYELAVAQGFVGTEAEWIASLKGPKGDTGTSTRITGITATTVAAGTNAGVLTGGTELERTIQFMIPRGNPGVAGTNATITGATATALAPGATPTVSMGGTESARTFTFGIPRGEKGADGTNGTKIYVQETQPTGAVAGELWIW